MKLSEVTDEEKARAEYLFALGIVCGDTQYNHYWMVAPRSEKTIVCIECGKRLRNNTVFAVGIHNEMISLGTAIWYWKLCRQERYEMEREEMFE